MKNQALKLFTLLTLSLVMLGCKSEKKEVETTEAKDVVEVAVETKYKVVPNESMIIWTANKIVGGHSGTINLSNGIAKTKAGSLVGGSFLFNMNSIKNTDIEDPKGQEKLVKHLKNEDFFEVSRYPIASFEITSVEGNELSGNLMMKGIKKNITVTVNTEIKEDMMTITSETFTIDRTEWNIKHNSGKFADPAKLGDYMIKDDVELKISINAKKV